MEVLSNEDATLPTLPLLHTTDAFYFENILETGELKTDYCDYLDESCAFTFYGIPSYRKSSNAASGNAALFPVCFVFNFDRLNTIYKLFPLDSGAFYHVSEVKSRNFHPGVSLEQLELLPRIDSARKLIKKFYQNNSNYINNSPTLLVKDVSPVNQAMYGYTTLINDNTIGKYDNRVSTIEIVFNKGLVINKDTLLQVIAPEVFLEDDRIIDLLSNKYGITNPLGYKSYRSMPSEYWGSIIELYKTVLGNDQIVSK